MRSIKILCKQIDCMGFVVLVRLDDHGGCDGAATYLPPVQFKQCFSMTLLWTIQNNYQEVRSLITKEGIRF